MAEPISMTTTQFIINAENIDKNGNPTGDIDQFEDLLVVVMINRGDTQEVAARLYYGNDETPDNIPAGANPEDFYSFADEGLEMNVVYEEYNGNHQILFEPNNVAFDLDGNGKIDRQPENTDLMEFRPRVMMTSNMQKSEMMALSDQVTISSTYTPLINDPLLMPADKQQAMETYIRQFVPEGRELTHIEKDYGDGMAVRSYSNLDFNKDGEEDLFVLTTFADYGNTESQFSTRIRPYKHDYIACLPCETSREERMQQFLDLIESIIAEPEPQTPPSQPAIDSTIQSQPNS